MLLNNESSKKYVLAESAHDIIILNVQIFTLNIGKFTKLRDFVDDYNSCHRHHED